MNLKHSSNVTKKKLVLDLKMLLVTLRENVSKAIEVFCVLIVMPTMGNLDTILVEDVPLMLLT